MVVAPARGSYSDSLSVLLSVSVLSSLDVASLLSVLASSRPGISEYVVVELRRRRAQAPVGVRRLSWSFEDVVVEHEAHLVGSTRPLPCSQLHYQVDPWQQAQASNLKNAHALAPEAFRT